MYLTTKVCASGICTTFVQSSTPTVCNTQWHVHSTQCVLKLGIHNVETLYDDIQTINAYAYQKSTISHIMTAKHTQISYDKHLNSK